MAKSKVSRMVQKAALRIIPIDSVKFDPSYQRDVVPKHKKIVSNFNPEALGVPVLGERDDGSIWCVDGRQRITALGKLGKKTVRAEVFASKGPEHEAEVFTLINKNRTALNPTQLFFAALTAGDKACWLIKGLVEEYGLKITRGNSQGVEETPENASKKINCVGTLRNILKNGDESALRFVLSVVAKVWPDDAMRLKKEVFDGLYTFFQRHEGSVDADRLIPRLMATTPAKLIYSAQLGVGDSGSNVADVIERLYRKRSAK